MNNERTSVFLMANLGSEVERLYTATDATHIRASIARASGILDALRVHPQLAGRLGEVELLAHILEDHIAPEPALTVSREEMRSYFMPFALRALNA